MDRSQVLDAMSQLKLYGMKAPPTVRSSPLW